MSGFTLIPDRSAALEGTAGYPDPEFFAMGISGAYPGAPAVGMTYDSQNPIEEEKDLPPGLRQLLVKFIFRVEGNFAEGDVVPIRFHGGTLLPLPPGLRASLRGRGGCR
jgi:hypothetical protein